MFVFQVEIQIAAVSALSAVSSKCFHLMSDKWQSNKVIDIYVKAVTTDPNPAAKRGSGLALGALHADLLCKHLDHVIGALVLAATTIQANTDERDPEARKNAVVGLVGVLKTAGLKACYGEAEGDGELERTFGDGGQQAGLNRPQATSLFDALVQCTDDYATDSRGDVGSWVREAAMKGLETFTHIACTADAERGLLGAQGGVFDEGMGRRVASVMVKQLGEKIDRVRDCAGLILHSILSPLPSSLMPIIVPWLPERKLLEDTFLAPDGSWAAGGATDTGASVGIFPRLAKLIDTPDYISPVLAGLVVSVGGITESLVKQSWSALLVHLRSSSQPETLALRVAKQMDALLVQHAGKDRIVVPLFKTLHLLVSSSCFDSLQPPTNPLPVAFFEMTQAELRGCKDVPKMQAGASLLCALIQFRHDSVRTPCLQTLLALLCHRYPKLRRHVGEQLYMALLTFSDLCPGEGSEEAMRVLSETDWAGEVSSLKPIRDTLYPIFGVVRVEPLPSQATSDSNAGAAAAPKPKEKKKDQVCVCCCSSSTLSPFRARDHFMHPCV